MQKVLAVEFEWDEGKTAANIRKHGVDFADAVLALEDDLALTMRDPDSEHEERFIAQGNDPYGRRLVVAYTWRGERVRPVSARKATGQERRRYEVDR